MTVMSNKLFTDDFFDPSYAFLSDKIIKMHAKRHMQSLENFVENSCNSSRASHQFLYTLLSILDNPTRLEELGPDKKQLLYMKLLSPPFDQFPSIVYSKKDNAAEDIKIFKKNLKAYRSDEYIYRALNIVRQLLERSDPSREWGYEPDNQPEFISKLRDEVDKIYLKFYTDLRDTEFPVKRLPTCSDTLCKMVIMDSRIYPVLPALFTLSAVYQAALDKSPGKAALLEFIIQPSLTDSCFTDNAYKTKVLSKLAYRLLNKIENTLIDNLNKYNTVVFPSKHINCPPSISALKFDDQQPPSEKVCFNQHINFAFPLCKTQCLATDIATACSLTMEQALELNTHISEHLLDKSYNEKHLREIYGDQVTEIIKGFRTLANPGTYYKQDSFINIYKTCVWGKLSASAKFFFVDPYDNSNNLPFNLYQFIRKYFTYVSLSRYVLYYSAPFRPLYGSSKMLPPGCKGIFRDFKTYSECYFTDTDVQPQLFPFAGTNTYLIGVKELRPSIRTELIRTFTPYSAVHFLMRHLEHPPKNKSALQQCINEYLKRYPLSKDIGILFRDTNEMIAVYQLMLKAALNIIAHYTVSLLADARIQTLQNHL